MDHYIDLRVLPDPEIAVSDVMNSLFEALHRRLHDEQTSALGISFPMWTEGSRELGNVLRVHGSSSDLAKLMNNGWIRRFSDAVSASGIQAVPDGALHRVVRRVQADSSVPRKARRYAKRHKVPYEDALRLFLEGGAKEEFLKLPALHVRSVSTGQRFPLFFKHGPLLKGPSPGTFSKYGLSDHASVPWF